jgi:hypothetical protein
MDVGPEAGFRSGRVIVTGWARNSDSDGGDGGVVMAREVVMLAVRMLRARAGDAQCGLGATVGVTGAGAFAAVRNEDQTS